MVLGHRGREAVTRAGGRACPPGGSVTHRGGPQHPRGPSASFPRFPRLSLPRRTPVLRAGHTPPPWQGEAGLATTRQGSPENPACPQGSLPGQEGCRDTGMQGSARPGAGENPQARSKKLPPCWGSTPLQDVQQHPLPCTRTLAPSLHPRRRGAPRALPSPWKGHPGLSPSPPRAPEENHPHICSPDASGSPARTCRLPRGDARGPRRAAAPRAPGPGVGTVSGDAIASSVGSCSGSPVSHQPAPSCPGSVSAIRSLRRFVLRVQFSGGNT